MPARNTAKKLAGVALTGATLGVFKKALTNAYHAGTLRPPNISATRYIDEAGLAAFMATGLYGGHLLVQKVPEWIRRKRTQKHHVYVYPSKTTKKKTTKRKKKSS